MILIDRYPLTFAQSNLFKNIDIWWQQGTNCPINEFRHYFDSVGIHGQILLNVNMMWYYRILVIETADNSYEIISENDYSDRKSAEMDCILKCFDISEKLIKKDYPKLVL